MRKILLLAIFSGIFTSENSYSQNKTSEEKQIIKTLRTFYREYFLEETKTKIDTDGTAGIGTDYTKIELLKKKYCTKNFLIKLEKAFANELDYDPLVNAQDFDMKDYETLKIIKDKTKSNVYLVSFGYFEYDKNNIQKPIKMVIVKDKGMYKIDSIIDSYWKL
jgi:hypothetical protein